MPLRCTAELTCDGAQDEPRRERQLLQWALAGWRGRVQTKHERRHELWQYRVAHDAYTSRLRLKAFRAWQIVAASAADAARAAQTRGAAFVCWRLCAARQAECGGRYTARCRLRAQGVASEAAYRRTTVLRCAWHAWRAGRDKAVALWRKRVLSAFVATLRLEVERTDARIAGHVEYWRLGRPLAVAWRTWLAYALRRRYSSVRVEPACRTSVAHR